MSKITSAKAVTVATIRAAKGKTPIVALTAYDFPLAQIMDPHCDMILVGDSVGQVVHGLESTVGVTMEMMILHGQAVVRGANHALVVVDMPFGSYENGPEQAFANASKILKQTGAPAVKLESGAHIAETIRYLVDRGIPVVGHVGLRPQAVHAMGTLKAKGRSRAEWDLVLAEAKATEEAGAFAIVIEGVDEALADEITRSVEVPTIGIGASSHCDGQILVTQDMLGLFEWTPKFVKRYGQLRETIDLAVQHYAQEVRTRRFPGQAEVYNLGQAGQKS